jgi:hypothetical protein
LVKAFKSFRFNPELYAAFKELAKASNCGVTEAFETFMQGCVEADRIVYAEKTDFEAEAGILVDWFG